MKVQNVSISAGGGEEGLAQFLWLPSFTISPVF